MEKCIYFIMSGSDNKVKYCNWTSNLATRIESHKSTGAVLKNGDYVLYTEQFEDLYDDEFNDLARHIVDSLGFDYGDIWDSEEQLYDGLIVDKFKGKSLKLKLWEDK